MKHTNDLINEAIDTLEFTTNSKFGIKNEINSEFSESDRLDNDHRDHRDLNSAKQPRDRIEPVKDITPSNFYSGKNHQKYLSSPRNDSSKWSPNKNQLYQNEKAESRHIEFDTHETILETPKDSKSNSHRSKTRTRKVKIKPFIDSEVRSKVSEKHSHS